MVMGTLSEEVEVAVVGGGPGGYVAAIRAADLGHEVVLIEERDRLGGVCLLEGCIPSKTLINAVELVDRVKAADEIGISYKDISLDHTKLRSWTDKVVSDLSSGISHLLKQRKVEVIKGRARFSDSRTLLVEGEESKSIRFKHCILATGSAINKLPSAYDLPLWTSAQALTLPNVPERLLVVGGGYIGLEMGLVYAGLGSKLSVIEFQPELLAGADQDLVNVVVKRCKERFDSILLNSKVLKVNSGDNGYIVDYEAEGKKEQLEVDQVLVAVGRRPNTDDIGLDKLKLKLDSEGRIPVNERMQTSATNIYAIGDIAPGPMLAHKASREGRIAAEVISGQKAALDNRAIPAVVFTDPEIAWAGITEHEASKAKMEVKVSRFPLTALGRAHTMGRTDGFVKIIASLKDDLVLGVGIVGVHASELIAECALAIEMGATLEDLMSTIHPHPTLSEAISEAAEVAAGHPVHIFSGGK